MSYHLFRPQVNVEPILEDLKEVLESGWLGLGPKTAEFESKFAEYVGARFAVALNSCTSALHLALVELGIRELDEVITTPITFVSTNHAILYQRAAPVFVDVDPDSLTIDIKEVEQELKQRTINAIMIVHYGGAPAKNIFEIHELARHYKVPVIEDAAHACGATYKDGTKIGSCPYEQSLTCFSFHAVKNLGIGDGGMITTNDPEVYNHLKQLRWMGIDKDTFIRTGSAENRGYNWLYDVSEVGFKYHMNDIQAVFALNQLKTLDEENQKRFQITQWYRDWIKNPEVSFLDLDTKASSNHLCVIKVDEAIRNDFIEYLNRNDIFPGVHYFPNHLYSSYSHCTKSLPVAEKVWKEIVSLPIYLGLEKEDIKKISGLINAYERNW